MIRSQSYCFLGVITIYFFFFLHPLLNTFASPTRSLCRSDQRDALLELRKEFPILSNNSKPVTTVSWNKSVDCCSWEGVTCDATLGEVILLTIVSHIGNTSLKPTSSLFKLQHLRELKLSNCNLQGEIPFSIGNLSHLTDLDLSYNQFDGLIPESISKLVNLEVLDLSHNNFLGRVPISISKLVNLTYLDLSNNKLEGQVPQLPCLQRSSHFTHIKLSNNSFSSFNKSMKVIDGASVLELNIGSNSFQGPFPKWICKLRNLTVFDVSNNHFTGSIPQCLRSYRLEELNLKNNNLSGFIPDLFIEGSQLLSLDVSGNNLVGKLPRSLINCMYMEFLNVKGNKLKDTFPFWLGSLLGLKVLALGSNAFYGPVYNPSAYFGFPYMRIIDISNNNFVGSLPEDYFVNWTAMSIVFKNGIDIPTMNYLRSDYSVFRSIDLVYKGVDKDIDRIFIDFKALDFSGNRFSGHIPESIGLLSQLRLLNLSDNAFIGNIPPSLANITNLEALDLSRNNLSGEIPQGLGKLSSLSIINFSHNHLEGLVPRSTQFGTQNCSSFVGNPGLYGLEDICKEISVPVPTSHQPEESLSEPEEPVLNWITAAIAFGPGVFCGLVIGHILTSYKYEWFIMCLYCIN